MRFWPYSLLSVAVLGACGSRTGLLVPGDRGFVEPDSAVEGDDAAFDAGPDATEDVAEIEDALPPIDVRKPPVDAFNPCPDAGATLVYVVTEQQQLLSFYPPTAEFTPIGPLRCPTASPSFQPFSMAVDRTGIAYVLYSDSNSPNSNSELFRVSTATGSCRATGFRTSQVGFNKFGMGYSHDDMGSGETLYVASGGDNVAATLGTINTQNFTLSVVGGIRPSIGSPELSGTGAGDLFAFFATTGANPCDNTMNGVNCADSAIGQIDKTTGKVTSESVLNGNEQGQAWAFAFWGGAFYTFTAPTNSGTVVNRFNPADGSLVTVARRSDFIVGAGVSTCAPAQ
jgi:hypothetical protein